MTEQLTAEDVARLTRERAYDEITQARADGRLDRILGVPEDQIALLEKARTSSIDGADAAALNRLGRSDLVVDAAASGRYLYPKDSQ